MAAHVAALPRIIIDLLIVTLIRVVCLACFTYVVTLTKTMYVIIRVLGAYQGIARLGHMLC